MARENTIEYRRLIVGLGLNTSPAAAVEIVAQIISAIRTDLQGLFIEDEEILDYSELPFARIVNSINLKTEPMDRLSMSKLLREHSRVCRRSLSELAAARNIPFDFTNVTGKPFSRIKELVTQSDIVVIEAEGYGQGLRDFVGRIKKSTTKAHGIVIYPQKRPAFVGPVIAIDDGDQLGRQTIKFAEGIARTNKSDLLIFMVADTEVDAERIEERAKSLVDPEIRLQTRVIPRNETDQLIGELQQLRPSFVIGDIEGEPFGSIDTTSKLIETIRVPIFLIR